MDLLIAYKSYLLIVAVVLVFPLVAGYIVLMERKVMADMQVRLGPMRVGPHGLLQPIADALKLLIKEDIIPARADRWVFWLAPVVPVTTALTAFAVLPFSQSLYITDLNIGIVFILALTSVGFLGIILGGWASNSHYSLLGSLRATAQLVSYEVALGFAIISGLMMAGTLSMVEIVRQQEAGHIWFFATQPVAFIVYLIAALAETNRAPFDMPEAESELVAGFMTEYSGFRWSLFFLAEYANIFVVASIATTLFLGGWLRPFPHVEWLNFLNYAPPVVTMGIGLACFYFARRVPKRSDVLILWALGLALVGLGMVFFHPLVLPYIAGPFWFLSKVLGIIYSFMWFRFTFPRYRYDQLMQVGWRVLIPVGIGNVILTGLVMVLGGNP